MSQPMNTTISPFAHSPRAIFYVSYAGCKVGISIPDASLAGALRDLLNPPPMPDGDPDLAIIWRDLTATVQPGDRRIRSSIPSRIPAMTLILLLERLRAALPDLVVLHGNAVYDSKTDRVVLIAGASGYGKSTLSVELLKDARFSLIAEDTLLMDLQSGVLHPFPRPASLRITAGGADGRPQWQGLGRNRDIKVLVPHERVCNRSVTLSNSLIVILGSSDINNAIAGSKHVGGGETFWLSHADEHLAADLRGEFSGATVRTPPDPERAYPAVSFPGVLNGDSRRMMLKLFAAHGAMVLAARVGDQKSALANHKRPPAPAFSGLHPFEGLRALLDHEVHFAAPDIPERDLGAAIMTLASSLSNASFHRLIPGGTPSASANCMLTALDGGN